MITQTIFTCIYIYIYIYIIRASNLSQLYMIHINVIIHKIWCKQCILTSITSFLNSPPLSLWVLSGEPYSTKIRSSLASTCNDSLRCRGASQWNLLKMSISDSMYQYVFPSYSTSCDFIHTRSIHILCLIRVWSYFICEIFVKFTTFWLAIHLMENLSFTQSSVGMWSLKSKFPCTHRFTLLRCSANNTLDVRHSKDLC